MSRNLSVISSTPAQTQRWGNRLGKLLKKGDVVLLLGDLGAGKTTFVQGLVKALGVNESTMSPTFVVAQSFDAKIPLHHLDFYRLSEKEILGLGAQDYITGGGEIPQGATLIEWADRCKGLWPKERLEIYLRIKPKSQDREIKFSAKGKRFEHLLHALKS